MWRVQLTHLFSATHNRVMGFKGQDGRKITWGHYRLAGQLGQMGTFPFANVLRMPIKVDPGNQFETLTSVNFRYEELGLTIGGEWYAREREKTSFRKCKNNVYGLVRAPLKDPESQEVIPGYDTSNPFSDEDLEVGETFLERRMLDPEVAATPAQSSFKIFASLGFADTGDYPLILGVGASYEFVSNNSGTDGVGIWGTFGLSF